MSSKKRKRDKEEEKTSKVNEQISSKRKERRGRKEKKTTKEEKEKILKSVEEDMNNYKKVIDLDENDFIPYSKDKISELPHQFNKQISEMIKIYIHKLNKEEKNKLANQINFSKTFKKIILILNMNENEFSFFTILLDKISLNCGDDFDIFEHLYYVGILTMQFLSDKFKCKKDEKFDKWKMVFKINDQMLNEISVKDINKRREELTISNDGYNSDDYLDYNQMVDDIIIKSRVYKDAKE